MPELTLYVTTWCPFCRRVLRFMDEHGIELDVRTIDTNDDDRAHLLEHGGKTQVPCLFIDGSPLYESADIIAYLAKTFG